jgi:hypothetical protein
MKTAWMMILALLMTSFFVNVTRADDDEPNWKEKFPNYELLGEKKVDFDADKDTIDVGGKEGRYVSILLGVIGGNLEMFDIKVKFANGDDYSPEVRHEFKQGERSRQIDLPGEARVINEVTFKYSSKIRKGKATVKLFGKPGAAGGGDNNGGGDWKETLPDSKEGYHFLGSREVSFGADKDVIEVGAGDGRFTAIVIGVVEGDLEMWNIKVEFGNGDDFSPDVRANFDSKSRSRVIELPDRDSGAELRVIKKVGFSYKSKRGEGKATVKLYGRPAGLDKRYQGYKHLGTREVDFAKDADSIVVGESKGKFTGFLVEVENADLEMKDITVTFGNGKQHEVDTRLEFNEGTRSRKVDFPGEARTVERIVFKYSTQGRKDGKATVNVYGKE